MTDFPQLLLVFFAVVNPASQARLYGSLTMDARKQATLWGFCLGAGLLVAAVFATDSILGFLEVEPETFRIAAGIVISAWGIRWMVPLPGVVAEERPLLRGAVPLGWPGIANPAAFAASLSYGADAETGSVVIVAVLWAATAAALALYIAPRFVRPAGWTAATTGAFAAIIGATLIVDGVLAV
jgi:small neutral amino acid transporter SnatA (MarC family)